MPAETKHVGQRLSEFGVELGRHSSTRPGPNPGAEASHAEAISETGPMVEAGWCSSLMKAMAGFGEFPVPGTATLC
jgi:hypothetical protein